MSRAAITLASVSATLAAHYCAVSPVENEPKRRFYEDEQQVVPLPGTVTPSTPAEAEILGPRSLINGVTVRTTAPLENAVKNVRLVLYDAYTKSYNYLHDKKHAVLTTEKQVTSTVAALHSKHEDLLPNSIYIVIAGLSGNIMARQRGIVARIVYPFALGVGAFWYFLPQTFHNTSDFLWRVEQRTMPALAQQQVAAYEHADKFVQLVEKSAVSGQQKVHSTWESVRQKISKVTGLNIDEEVSKK